VAKFEVPDRGIKSTLHRVKVDFGIGLPMRAVYMLELEEAHAFVVVFIWVHTCCTEIKN
jgi:hypothetical protein